MKIWIYKDGAQSGPYEPDQLAGLGITRSTKVWYSGLPRWCEAGTVPELAFLFGDEAAPQQTAAPVFIAPAPAPQIDAAPQPQAPPCPPAHLVWSILLTVVCCSPLAVAAIVTGIMSTARHAAGNYGAARRLSEATEWLIMLAVALGALPSMLMLALL